MSCDSRGRSIVAGSRARCPVQSYVCLLFYLASLPVLLSSRDPEPARYTLPCHAKRTRWKRRTRSTVLVPGQLSLSRLSAQLLLLIYANSGSLLVLPYSGHPRNCTNIRHTMIRNLRTGRSCARALIVDRQPVPIPAPQIFDSSREVGHGCLDLLIAIYCNPRCARSLAHRSFATSLFGACPAAKSLCPHTRYLCPIANRVAGGQLLNYAHQNGLPHLYFLTPCAEHPP